MNFSDKTNFGLIIIIDIFTHQKNGNVKLSDVAKRNAISLSYLELIAASLKKSGLIISKKGQSGGYSVSREPSKITVLDVFESVEGEIEQHCLEAAEANIVEYTYKKTKVVKPLKIELIASDKINLIETWVDLGKVVKDVLLSYTLERIIKEGNSSSAKKTKLIDGEDIYLKSKGVYKITPEKIEVRMPNSVFDLAKFDYRINHSIAQDQL